MAEPGNEGKTTAVVGGKVKRSLGLLKNKKVIIAATVIVLLIGGFVAYKVYFRESPEEPIDIPAIDPTTPEGNKRLQELYNQTDISGENDEIKLEYHRNKALVYMNNDEFENAISALKEAEAISPNEPAILGALGSLYDRQGDTVRAIEYYKKALAEYKKLNPSLPGVKQKIEELNKLVGQ